MVTKQSFTQLPSAPAKASKQFGSCRCLNAHSTTKEQTVDIQELSEKKYTTSMAEKQAKQKKFGGSGVQYCHEDEMQVIEEEERPL